MPIISNQEVTLASEGQPVSDVRTFPAAGQAREVTAVLQGFDVQFSNRQDHELGRLFVAVTADFVHEGLIEVRTDFGLRDWSGGDDELTGDDPINARILYSVIVV